MTTYLNSRKDSLIDSVEITPQASGNQSIFYLRPGVEIEDFRRKLEHFRADQHVISSAKIDGKDVLITNGSLSAEGLLADLNANGEWLISKPKPFAANAWKWRAVLGFVGQGFEMASAIGGGKMDYSRMTFSGANITANVIALTHGASSVYDEHKLQHLKQETNEFISSHVTDKRLIMPSPDTHLHQSGMRESEDLFDKGSRFVDRNSSKVNVGLRVFGSASLLNSSLQDSKNNLILSNTSVGAGSAILAGKMLALAGKVDDPYNPKPLSLMDRVREKFFFAGGVMEAAGFGTYAYIRSQRAKNSMNLADRRAGYLSTAANSIFVLAYISRLFAKLGDRMIDKDELYAHVAEVIKQAPKEQLPQLIVDTSAMIKEQYDMDGSIELSDIYNGIVRELYMNHGISVDPEPIPNTPPEKQEQTPDNSPNSRLVADHKASVSPMSQAAAETSHHL